LLPERDPHPQIHATLDHVLGTLVDARLAGPRMARFELQLLAELGFGLDLESCAATGTTAELVYVSPKSGRAVSREAGRPWRDKLLRLPAFLAEPEPAEEPSAGDLADAFAVTGFFLLRHVLEPRGLTMPDARGSFVSAAVSAHQVAPAIA
jgi:DNA repair protein RecO (recombination protein O)